MFFVPLTYALVVGFMIVGLATLFFNTKMKMQWILGLALVAVPFLAGAAEMDGMSKEDMDKMGKPAAIKQEPTAVTAPVKKVKKIKKATKKTKKDTALKGVEMNRDKNEVTGTAKAEGAKASAKKEHWVCPMHDGGESDHAGACPKCGMALVRE